MSSPGNQRHHKANTGGPSNMKDRRSRLSDDVLVEYERFMSFERTRRQGGKSVTTHRCEVTGSSISGRTEAQSDRGESAEVSTSGDHCGSKEVVLRAEGMNNLPWLFPRSYKWGLRVHFFPLP
ncbi:hypothetical protein ACOSQ2_007161 [Xanthoceras sorbifolium]